MLLSKQALSFARNPEHALFVPGHPTFEVHDALNCERYGGFFISCLPETACSTVLHEIVLLIFSGRSGPRSFEVRLGCVDLFGAV